MRRFAGSFNNAQLVGLVGQIADRIGGRVLGGRLGYKIQPPVDHFWGNVGERPRQGLGHGVGQVDQHRVQQPGGPDLHFDGIFGAAVEIRQPQQALDDGAGVFHPPALAIQGHDIEGGQAGHLQGIGQVAIDRAVRLDLDQTDLLAGGTLANPDEPILHGRGVDQDLRNLILEVLFCPGQPGHPARGQGGPRGEIGEAAVKEDQGPDRPHHLSVCPKPLFQCVSADFLQRQIKQLILPSDE